MDNVVFVTGNADKAARFARHMEMDIVHEPAELGNEEYDACYITIKQFVECESI